MGREFPLRNQGWAEIDYVWTGHKDSRKRSPYLTTWGSRTENGAIWVKRKINLNLGHLEQKVHWRCKSRKRQNSIEGSLVFEVDLKIGRYFKLRI
jgi:hypothetical protein